MEGAKGKMKVCKTYDEVNSEEGSIPPPMEEGPLKFYKQLCYTIKMEFFRKQK